VCVLVCVCVCVCVCGCAEYRVLVCICISRPPSLSPFLSASLSPSLPGSRVLSLYLSLSLSLCHRKHPTSPDNTLAQSHFRLLIPNFLSHNRTQTPQHNRSFLHRILMLSAIFFRRISILNIISLLH